MEVDLNEIFSFIKDQIEKILFLKIIIKLIYIIYLLSKGFLKKIRKINDINSEINKVKNKITNVNEEINFYQNNIDNVSTQILSKQQINKSMIFEYNFENKKCKTNFNNFTNNLKKLSIKLPKDIRLDMYALLDKVSRENKKRTNTLYQTHLQRLKSNQLRKQQILNNIRAKQYNRNVARQNLFNKI